MTPEQRDKVLLGCCTRPGCKLAKMSPSKLCVATLLSLARKNNKIMPTINQRPDPGLLILIIELKKRLTAAGKSKMAIVGAAMRKLVHIILWRVEK